jgi:polyphosphate:AMP phosphotransferase
MFEAAELGTTVSKDEYKARMPDLRASLLAAQQILRHSAEFPVIVILAGLETAGRSETANLLNQWMDPRGIETRAWRAPTDEEEQRPPFWRFWRALPPKGRVGLFLNGWYESPVRDRVERRCGKRAFDGRLERVAAFERTLVDDGAVIVKFWLHIDARTQRARLKAFAKDPLRRWRATKQERRSLRLHPRILEAAEQAIRRTSTEQAPWHIVEGTASEYRNLVVASRIRDAIHDGLKRAMQRSRRVATPRSGAAAEVNDPIATTLDSAAVAHSVLGALDLSHSLEKKRFRVALERQQGRLYQLQRRAFDRGLSTVAVFEGWDAAGKGGAIRRVAGALDARDYRVIPVAAPTEEERAQHYLWRFWRHLPRAGHVVIFDRSWYGRVLVERVEGLATAETWGRAYTEINEFEDRLVDHGILLLKFWIHISKDEQLKRFQDRRKTSHKQWKITDEDWRNRRKWEDYERAVNEMVARTSTRRAPWVLIEGNDKNFARVKVIRTFGDRLARVLKRS